MLWVYYMTSSCSLLSIGCRGGRLSHNSLLLHPVNAHDIKRHGTSAHLCLCHHCTVPDETSCDAHPEAVCTNVIAGDLYTAMIAKFISTAAGSLDNANPSQSPIMIMPRGQNMLRRVPAQHKATVMQASRQTTVQMKSRGRSNSNVWEEQH